MAQRYTLPELELFIESNVVSTVYRPLLGSPNSFSTGYERDDEKEFQLPGHKLTITQGGTISVAWKSGNGSNLEFWVRPDDSDAPTQEVAKPRKKKKVVILKIPEAEETILSGKAIKTEENSKTSEPSGSETQNQSQNKASKPETGVGDPGAASNWTSIFGSTAAKAEGAIQTERDTKDGVKASKPDKVTKLNTPHDDSGSTRSPVRKTKIVLKKGDQSLHFTTPYVYADRSLGEGKTMHGVFSLDSANGQVVFAYWKKTQPLADMLTLTRGGNFRRLSSNGTVRFEVKPKGGSAYQAFNIDVYSEALNNVAPKFAHNSKFNEELGTAILTAIKAAPPAKKESSKRKREAEET